MPAATTYTTTQKIRDEAWFTNNTNIWDAQIDGYRIQANGRLNTMVGQKYSLPLNPSQLSASPAAALLDLIEMLLAAGLLLDKEYWEDAAGTDKYWPAKIKRAEDMMAQILSGEIKLLDNAGGSFDTWGGQELKISGYPTDSADRKFSVNMKF